MRARETRAQRISIMTESDLLKRIQSLATGDVRLFRNNVGGLRDAQGRYVRYGLCVGSSDLIGLRSLVITPKMIGQRMAIFVALEAKSEFGRATDEQRRFIDMVGLMGGAAGIVRSEEDAMRILGIEHGIIF